MMEDSKRFHFKLRSSAVIVRIAAEVKASGLLIPLYPKEGLMITQAGLKSLIFYRTWRLTTIQIETDIASSQLRNLWIC